jgi:hypothetical protein
MMIKSGGIKSIIREHWGKYGVEDHEKCSKKVVTGQFTLSADAAV